MVARNRNQVGAYDAKTRLSELLERVEAGEEITITRHGSPVARLVPIERGPSVEARQQAVEQMRQLASKNKLGSIKVKDLVAEGRR